MGAKASKIHDEPLEQYPLRGQYQIRLLDCSSPSGYLRLETFSLHECPPFSALSYVWGRQKGGERVDINGVPVKVTQNLYDFLVTFSGNRWLWIDALCINQLDPGERSQQVALMKELYEAAQEVIIWLGNTTGDMKFAFDLLERSGDRYARRNPFRGIRRMIYSGYNEKDLQVLGDLFSREYWSRAWIIQEATAPVAKSRIWCGENKLDLDRFCRGYRYFNDFGGFLEATRRRGYTINDTISAILNIKEARSSLKPGEGIELYTLLQLVRGQNCTDPRDKIYSILSISTEAENVARPNYLRPVEETYLQLAILFIGRHNLDFLGFAGFKQSTSLPSWVPDWTVKDCPRFISRSVQEAVVFNAGANTVPLVGYLRIGIKNKLGIALRLTGFLFDTIERVSIPRTQNLGLKQSFIRSWSDVTFSSARPVGENVKDELCQTLTAGSGHTIQRHVKRMVENVKGSKADMQFYWRDTFSCIVEETMFRALARTKLGYLALVPDGTRAGDRVCVFWGGRMPCVLREEDLHWHLVGECYTHGIMDGEAWVDFNPEIKTIIPSGWTTMLRPEKEKLKAQVLAASHRIRDFDLW
jgi:hypothetical protein